MREASPGYAVRIEFEIEGRRYTLELDERMAVGLADSIRLEVAAYLDRMQEASRIE